MNESIQKLVEAVQQASPVVWRAAYRQVWIDGIENILLALLFVSIARLCWNWRKKFLAKDADVGEIFRNAGGEAIVFDGIVEELKPANCQGCSETHEVGWVEGEWHHNVRSRGGRRCDCAACALYVCRAWHQRFHNRVVKFLQRGTA